METQVTGFLYEKEEGGMHAHELILTSWGGRPVHVHVHAFAGVTSTDLGHHHRYAGTTAPAPSGVPHTHRYEVVTSFDDGHSHVIRGVTGPAVPVPGGGHIHYFEGVTTASGAVLHTHHYRGYTRVAR
ncbi:MAG: hypothetical protein IMW86_02505 [Hydrogenibacillus sp.]|nr:hypothetical protein [Hydrogenibacillus sp.]